MKISKFISKDLVIGGIAGSILATIITSIIDTKTVNKSNEELDISKEQLKKLAEDLEKMDVLARKAMDDQDEVVKAQGLKIQELEDELKEYKKKEYEEREKQIKIDAAKKAIEEKNWDDVYHLTERWYNHYPVQMSRSEVFTNLEKDEYITDENYNEARVYFKTLWNYVGD